MTFDTEFPFEERLAEAKRVLSKYPDRVPVIVERAPGAHISNIDKKKFLVPADLTVGNMIFVIRKRIKLKPEEALFIFVNGVLPRTSELMSVLYQEHKSDDLFLKIQYNGEEVFGGN